MKKIVCPAVPKLFFLLFFIILFTQCRKDSDDNYQIVIKNHCDFDIVVNYSTNQYWDEEKTQANVSYYSEKVAPHSSKTVDSWDKEVMITKSAEPNDITKRFKCKNENFFLKKIDVYPEDFD